MEKTKYQENLPNYGILLYLNTIKSVLPWTSPSSDPYVISLACLAGAGASTVLVYRYSLLPISRNPS
jgi:hypothetical protein